MSMTDDGYKILPISDFTHYAVLPHNVKIVT